MIHCATTYSCEKSNENIPTWDLRTNILPQPYDNDLEVINRSPFYHFHLIFQSMKRNLKERHICDKFQLTDGNKRENCSIHRSVSPSFKVSFQSLTNVSQIVLSTWRRSVIKESLILEAMSLSSSWTLLWVSASKKL